MKKVVIISIFILTMGIGAFAQMGDMKNAPKPTEKDKTEAIPARSYLKRGEPIGSAKKESLNKVLADPTQFVGKKIRFEGVVVRSCKMEGCWAEVAENKGGKSIRVNMKGHSFFIPLQSAGSLARVEGSVVVKTLTKDQVDHMIKDDGAKFENRNADGSVSEVSFEATGIELKKGE